MRRVLATQSESHFPFLLLLLGIVILVGLPLFQSRQMAGHDTFAYLPRIEEFYQQLQNGILFPRWAPDFSAGYGQPFFLFNPPVIYYFASAFHFLQFTFVVSENLTFFLILLLSGFGMYLLADEFFGKQGALAAAAAYLCGPYLLVNIYVRHALADFSAFAFMPLAWWGLFKFCQQGRHRFLLAGALTSAGLMLSANTIALIAFPSLAIFLIFLAGSQPSQRLLVLKRGMVCLGLGLGLATFFWIPALFQRDWVQTDRLITGQFNFHDHFVYPDQLIYSNWGYGNSNPGPVDGMSFELGVVQWCCVAIAIWQFRNLANRSRGLGWVVAFFLILIGFSAFFSSELSGFLWNRLRLLQYFQFPWRFLSLATVSTAFLCGLPFLRWKDRPDKLSIGLLIVFLSALYFQSAARAQPSGYNSTTDGNFTPQRIASDNISVATFNEYETIWMIEHPKQPATERVTLTSGAGKITEITSGPTQLQFRAILSEPSTLRVNIAYFPGWTLRVNDQPVKISYNNPLGVMEFPLSQGTHAVRLQFEDTPIVQVSQLASILALLTLIIFPRLPKKMTGLA